jgi:ubiquinone/menaquinone biosynthesis C-methylase UbiE
MNDRQVSDTWKHGDPYEQYVGRWSRRVAPVFLAWLGVPAGRRWVDVGCGTGALCAAIVQHCSPLAVTGVEPSEGFLLTAKSHLGERVAFHTGSASVMPLQDGSADAVVSGLVVNFVPDPLGALREMARVAVRHGTIAAYVWDYAGKMELMRYFWDAALALDPLAAKLDEAVRFPLCQPEPLKHLFEQAGLREIEVTGIDVPTPFSCFEEYWRPFLGGQGPAPAYAMSLTEEARARLRDRLRESLPIKPDGSIELIARAWAIRATAPKQLLHG